MASVADLYNKLVSPHLDPKPPQVPYFSTVYGRQVQEAKAFGPSYWQLNMESPVLFRTAVSEMLREMGPNTAHLEVGPHSALAGPLRQIYEETGLSAPYASTMVRGQNSCTAFLEGIGKFFCFGLSPQIPSSKTRTVLPDIPTYPWDYKDKFWSETRVMSNWRFKKHRTHELLGERSLESSDIEPCWRNLLRTGTVPWLADHCVGSDIIFPAAGFIAMAGAAASQLAGSDGHYTVREVHIFSALVLHETTATELITTLRKQPLTSSLQSKWFEFSISSESNGVWTKYCSGLVTASVVTSAGLPEMPDTTVFSRKVDTSRWYTTMSRIGLNYGRRFVGLEDISCSPVHQVASVQINDVQDDYEPYPLHPSTIDKFLQSWTLAFTKGEYRLLTQLYLPTFIEELSVAPAPGKKISGRTLASGIPGTTVGSSLGVVDDELVFSLRGFKCKKTDDAFIQNVSKPRSMTLEWHLDTNFTDLHQLIKPTRDTAPENEILERLYVLYALENWDQLKNSTSSHPHLNIYLSWLEEEVKGFTEPGHPLISDSKELVSMDVPHRRREIAFLRQRSKHYPMAAAVEVYARTCARMVEIMEGNDNLLNVLLEDDLLAKFYNYYNDASDLSSFFQAAGLNKPHMRVLEIGAGTGGWTAHALRGLTSELGDRLYEEYTITDVSHGFLNQCKERFAAHSNIKYALLDISSDPLEQGFEEGYYDIVIASNVRESYKVAVLSLILAGSACYPEACRDPLPMPQGLEPGGLPPDSGSLCTYVVLL